LLSLLRNVNQEVLIKISDENPFKSGKTIFPFNLLLLSKICDHEIDQMIMNKTIKITEAPRDAMQGIKQFIPTEKKAALINALLKVGFDIIDFGSFVSPKAIPQLSDTSEVIKKLDMSSTTSKLMAIVCNSKGARQAAEFDEIAYIGFPFSFSETFLKLNINANIEKARKTADEIHEICRQKGKKPLVYISMAFGNPYGDPWSIDLILQWTKYFADQDIDIIALSDIIGIADGGMIGRVFGEIFGEVANLDIGLHLHTHGHNWYEKIDAAWSRGCRRFDGVMSGLGGCPMAGYELVGNLNTRHLLEYFDKNNIPLKIDRQAFEEAYKIAMKTYPVL
jgi:hydroxymethylglutaryl-CoA lyase